MLCSLHLLDLEWTSICNIIFLVILFEMLSTIDLEIKAAHFARSVLVNWVNLWNF